MKDQALHIKHGKVMPERERYTALYDFAPMAYILFNENNVILDLNSAACQLFGKERARLVGHSITSYLVPASLKAFISHRKLVEKSGQPQDCELEIRTIQGHAGSVFVHMRSLAIKSQGEKKGICRSVMTNITQHKKNVVALARSRDLLLALARAAQSVLLAETRDEIYRAVGEQVQKLGFNAVFLMSGEKPYCSSIEYTSFDLEVLASLEQTYDFVVGGSTFILLPETGILGRSLYEEKAFFAVDAKEELGKLLPAEFLGMGLEIIDLYDIQQFVSAPLSAGGDVGGLLLVTGANLAEMDVSAVGIFAAQVAISLRNAQLTERLNLALEREKKLAQRDPLTGVRNRRAFNNLIEKELSIAQRYERMFSVLMLDIDHFKRINDQFGHNAGDEMLIHVTKVIESELRKADVLARYGGEEFVVLLPETALSEASCLAERLRNAIAAAPLRKYSEEITATASFGVLGYSNGIQDHKDMMKKVDQALYAAKKKGRNCVCVHK